MYEDRPEKDTPDWIRAELADYGGRSPDGQPIWRLVLMQNCRIRCFGTLNHLADGLDVETMAETARPTDISPVRVEEGEFWVQRYRGEGWILQRWYPPHCWGSREKWEGERAKDGRTRMLARYPAQGDYMMMPAGPWKTIAEAGDLKAAIRCYNAQQRRNPVNWENLMLAQLAWEQNSRQQKAEAYAEEVSAQHREGIDHVLRSVSPSAQAFRNVVSQHTASGVNLGASEKWGS